MDRTIGFVDVRTMTKIAAIKLTEAYARSVDVRVEKNALTLYAGVGKSLVIWKINL